MIWGVTKLFLNLTKDFMEVTIALHGNFRKTQKMKPESPAATLIHIFNVNSVHSQHGLIMYLFIAR